MAGFDERQKLQDEWAKELRRKNGLAEDASNAEVEAKATELLSGGPTLFTGAELVLGRRISTQDAEDIRFILNPSLDGKDRFALLLMYKTTEKTKGEKH